MLYILIAIAAACVAVDQLTKLLIFGHDSAVIEGVVRFASVENRGVAWGFLDGVNGAMIIISAVTFLILGLIVFAMIKYRDIMPRSVSIPLSVITGGALGNLIDRIFVGFVRDFICTEFISFPVFNFADICVTCGGVALAAVILFSKSGREFMNRLFPEKKKDV